MKISVKTCTKCKNSLPLSDFAFKVRIKGTIQSNCRKCQSIYLRSHFIRNKHKYILYNRNKKKQLREIVIKYLIEHPCIDCGETDPACLDFDHQRDKKYNISNMVTNSIKTLYAEIAKCKIRCASCHRKKTAKKNGWYKKYVYLFSTSKLT